MSNKKLFLTSWPSGRLILVDVIEPVKDRNNCFYIRYPNGGTDTTSTKFLFDAPKELANNDPCSK